MQTNYLGKVRGIVMIDDSQLAETQMQIEFFLAAHVESQHAQHERTSNESGAGVVQRKVAKNTWRFEQVTCPRACAGPRLRCCMHCCTYVCILRGCRANKHRSPIMFILTANETENARTRQQHTGETDNPTNDTENQINTKHASTALSGSHTQQMQEHQATQRYRCRVHGAAAASFGTAAGAPARHQQRVSWTRASLHGTR